jgi:hypothetical protein
MLVARNGTYSSSALLEQQRERRQRAHRDGEHEQRLAEHGEHERREERPQRRVLRAVVDERRQSVRDRERFVEREFEVVAHRRQDRGDRGVAVDGVQQPENGGGGRGGERAPPARGRLPQECRRAPAQRGAPHRHRQRSGDRGGRRQRDRVEVPLPYRDAFDARVYRPVGGAVLRDDARDQQRGERGLRGGARERGGAGRDRRLTLDRPPRRERQKQGSEACDQVPRVLGRLVV